MQRVVYDACAALELSMQYERVVQMRHANSAEEIVTGRDTLQPRLPGSRPLPVGECLLELGRDDLVEARRVFEKHPVQASQPQCQLAHNPSLGWEGRSEGESWDRQGARTSVRCEG